ncbi:MAG: ATP-binding protein [Candidatus Hydrogenedentota bacterium]
MREEEANAIALMELKLKLEEALAQLKTSREKISQQEHLRSLGQMASGIVHDFNNALTTIMGFTELLLINPNDRENRKNLKKYLKIIYTAATDAANIVNRLKEFYRTKRDKDEIIEPLDINQIIKDTIFISKPRWKEEVEAKGITITIKTKLDKIPIIYGDISEMREVFINLIFNAVDAMPSGGKIFITTTACKKDNTITISVRDTGIGMSKEVCDHCFDPFFTTKSDKGSGLGLSVVFGIITRYNGRIEVESEKGKGTTFLIKLPVISKEVYESPDKELKDIMTPMNILVIDDNPGVRKIITKYLKIMGHSVDDMNNGYSALQHFKIKKYDLVITDRAMPKMSGDQLAGKIKRLSPTTPIILLTGFGEIMKAEDDLPSNVDYILGKPITSSTLRKSILKVINDIIIRNQS